MDSRLPPLRVRAKGSLRPDGTHVLYWMTAARRLHDNFALQRAVELAVELDRPLVVLEPLRCGYRWASDRLHRFVLDGMADHAATFAERGVLYHPYVEPEADAGKGLLAAWAKDACAVVTDDSPAFFYRRMLRSALQQVPCRMEAVDGNGLLPLRATDRVFTTAFSFRAWLHKNLKAHLMAAPVPDPLDGVTLPASVGLPRDIANRWPAASARLLSGGWAMDSASSDDTEAAHDSLAGLPIDHSVPPAPVRGGPRAAHEQLATFLTDRLPRYATDRNQPQLEAASGLSPWLHFGHISSHAVLAGVASREDWTPQQLPDTGAGARAGWWGMSEDAEAFVDQLVTWREVGFNMCHHRPDYDTYESLPDWARATMEQHAGDERPHLYDLAELENAQTHDPLWNAAQNQLRVEGRVHNYLRMLWGKKIYEWSPGPREALATLIHLNDKYALDGRDPNSISGITWCLGRYDRAWGPERPIFGKIRYMSSENTARKVRVKEYIARWTGTGLVPGASLR
jgi:deoxyribodipyrimidine photo-lyase